MQYKFRSKSKFFHSIVEKIDDILHDTHHYDFGGQPSSDQDLQMKMDELKKIDIIDPSNGLASPLFGMSTARALIFQEIDAKMEVTDDEGNI
tara:strand:- start:845 stop:1120 length:276 start_codon:yes stop_codon:yes gene_type:complete